MLRPNTNPTIYQEDRIILMCLEASEHCILKFHKVMKCMKAGLSRRKGATAWGKLNSSFPHLMTVSLSLPVCESLAMGDDLSSSLPDWGCLHLPHMLQPHVALAKMLGKLPRTQRLQKQRQHREGERKRLRGKSVLIKRHVEEGTTRNGIRSGLI